MTARTLALLIVALVVGLSIRYNSFAAWATDSGAYISAAHRWADADLFTPASFLFWAPWAADGLAELPYGHVSGPVTGTIVGQYPLGYPLLLATAIQIGGPLAAYVVAPLTAGLLTWCAFVLGRSLATPWAGVIAALLIAATPVSFSHLLMPFSDVPSTAFWALAWVMSVRAGRGAAAAAGTAVALAVMIRPNLAPLALVIALALAASQRWPIRSALSRLLIFSLVAALGPLMVLWSQAALYGDPLQSGYRVPMSSFYALERIPHNAWLYPHLLRELHSGVAFAGVLLLPLILKRPLGEAPERSITIALSAVGLILVNYALYLPYLSYEGWYWLRFMLPAMLALFVLLAAGLDCLRVCLRGRWPGLSVLAFAPVLIVLLPPAGHLRPPDTLDRISSMGHYLREALSRDAVILTNTHGGALAAATGRPIVRLDAISSTALDGVIGDLRRRGWRPVYVLDSHTDATPFTERFRASSLARLIWPARAEISSGATVLYYDLADRESFLSGERWPTDVVLDSPSVKATVDWGAYRAPLERVVLPLPEETAAFRSTLEDVYRRRLGRPAHAAAVDPREALKWTRRYLRFRLHDCNHEVAVGNVLEQIRGGAPPPLCARPGGVSFPPRNETVDFRRRLQNTLPIAAGTATTAVDLEGETVWTQEYLQLRTANCSHHDATAAVVSQILGQKDAASCR